LARYKFIDTSPRFIALDLQRPLLPGTFEHALDHLLDHQIDLSALDARYRNDRTGATAYPPATCAFVADFPAAARAHQPAPLANGAWGDRGLGSRQSDNRPSRWATPSDERVGETLGSADLQGPRAMDSHGRANLRG